MKFITLNFKINQIVRLTLDDVIRSYNNNGHDIIYVLLLLYEAFNKAVQIVLVCVLMYSLGNMSGYGGDLTYHTNAPSLERQLYTRSSRIKRL